MKERDLQLMQSEDDFVKMHCTLEFFKGSGAGGQHRNKTSSAVRVTHIESGLAAEDCTERSQHRNRSNAVRKLKMLIALNIRNIPAIELIPRMECSMNAPDYPLFVAQLLDIIVDCQCDHKAAALRCNISNSALVKKLARDPAVWQKFCKLREDSGLPQLHL